MFSTTFGHGIIKKYVILVGTLFNNLHVNRYDNAGTLIQTQKIPLNYGPREKFLARVEGNPDSGREIAITLPRISFEMTNLYYDATRKTVRTNKISVANPTNANTKSFQYSPVPYNIDFSLSIMTKSVEDGTYIVEQILPYFTPDFTTTLLINPDLGLKYDIPLSINSVTNEDSYEGQFEVRRAVIWNLTFTLKGWFFGPTNTTGGKIIKEIDTNFLIPAVGQTVESANTTNTLSQINMQITPGQYANGSAANWYGAANAAIRPTVINPSTIKSTDSWDFIVDFTESI